MTPAQERSAEASAIQKMHGEEGPLWIASRIGALALAGAVPGLKRFRADGAGYETLLTATVQ